MATEDNFNVNNNVKNQFLKIRAFVAKNHYNEIPINSLRKKTFNLKKQFYLSNKNIYFQ